MLSALCVVFPLANRRVRNRSSGSERSPTEQNSIHPCTIHVASLALCHLIAPNCPPVVRIGMSHHSASRHALSVGKGLCGARQGTVSRGLGHREPVCMSGTLYIHTPGEYRCAAAAPDSARVTGYGAHHGAQAEAHRRRKTVGLPAGEAAEKEKTTPRQNKETSKAGPKLPQAPDATFVCAGKAT